MKHLKDLSVQYLKGVGPSRMKIFERLGIANIEQLFYFFPRRYEDRTRMVPLSQVRLGEFQSVTGRVMARGARQSWYTRKHLYEIAVGDDHGRISVVWFNQPYLEKYFQVGRRVVLYGKVDRYKDRLQMVSPEYEIIDDNGDQSLSMGRIVPVYPLTRGISQRYLRKTIRTALDLYLNQLDDRMPEWLRYKHHLGHIQSSLGSIHFPEQAADQDKALWRISFEEFFFFQLSVMKRRLSIVRKTGYAHRVGLDFFNRFSGALPFALTAAQTRVIREIAGDMQQTAPMLRLLQGDVGSGKTVVALFGCLSAVENGRQAAMMAPTEILARQHYESMTALLAGGPFKNVRIELLVSGMTKAKKDDIALGLESGTVHILIGTHALLNADVRFAALSFVAIDEQHKFGVRQRALLSTKGVNPDVLVMTATPIPRTLSLTLFGDLDVSTIDELPRNRGRVRTEVFPMDRAEDVYRAVREKVLAGEQAYIVYPIVEESEKLDLKAAQAMFDHFQKHEFKGLSVGLVHGQMKRAQSEEAMARFKQGAIQVLVATTVLEVGVDVPNANVMVIEHAERFGLAQLHQLRGRIGRGNKDGWCYLIADAVTEEGQARVKAIVSTTDGFKIAEEDLMIRGPGHYFGRHQHGLNELRFSNPAAQIDILELARKEAQEVIHQDPALHNPAHAGFMEAILERFPGYMANVEAG